MSTTAVPFDHIAHMRLRNETEAAQRDGKPAPAKPEVKVEPTPPPAPEGKEEKPNAERSQRRAERRLYEQIGAERAQREMLEKRLAELEGKKPVVAEEDPEPSREKFASDAEYNRALGRWDARQEAKAAVSKVTEQAKSSEELTNLREHMQAMDLKAQEDAKLLPDFAAVAKAAAEDEDAIEVDWDKQPTLLGLIAGSDVKAFVLYHFAKEQAEFQKILDLKDPGAQIRAFHRLEGRVEKLYEGKPAEKREEKKEPTAAERDVKKAKPSESAAVTGGSAPSENVSPTLADGRTMNPAWKERANMRDGGRR